MTRKIQAGSVKIKAGWGSGVGGGATGHLITAGGVIKLEEV